MIDNKATNLAAQEKINLFFDNSGIWMGEHGNNEFIFKKTIIFNNLNKLEKEDISIVGGDVFEYIDGTFKYANAGWSIDKFKDESDSEYLKRSIIETREYLSSFKENQNHYFSLFINDPASVILDENVCFPFEK